MKRYSLMCVLLAPAMINAQAVKADTTFASLAELLVNAIQTSSTRGTSVVDRASALRVLGIRGGSAETTSVETVNRRSSRFVSVIQAAGRRNPFGADTALHVLEGWAEKSSKTWVLSISKIARNFRGAEESVHCYLPVRQTANGRWGVDSLPKGRRGQLFCFAS